MKIAAIFNIFYPKFDSKLCKFRKKTQKLKKNFSFLQVEFQDAY